MKKLRRSTQPKLTKAKSADKPLLTTPFIAADGDTNDFSIFANILYAKSAAALPIKSTISWIEWPISAESTIPRTTRASADHATQRKR